MKKMIMAAALAACLVALGNDVVIEPVEATPCGRWTDTGGTLHAR